LFNMKQASFPRMRCWYPFMVSARDADWVHKDHEPDERFDAVVARREALERVVAFQPALIGVNQALALEEIEYGLACREVDHEGEIEQRRHVFLDYLLVRLPAPQHVNQRQDNEKDEGHGQGPQRRDQGASDVICRPSMGGGGGWSRSDNIYIHTYKYARKHTHSYKLRVTHQIALCTPD